MCDRESALRAEIAELEELIAKWDGSDDPETQWAIYLLNRCLENRKEELKRTVH